MNTAVRRNFSAINSLRFGLLGTRSVGLQVLVQFGDLLGIQVYPVVAFLAPGYLRQDGAAILIEHFPVRSAESVGKPQTNGRAPRWPVDEDLVGLEAQPHPDKAFVLPTQTVLTSQVRRPRGTPGENEPDVVCVGGEQGLRVAGPQTGEVEAEHPSHRPGIQRGQRGGERGEEDGWSFVATSHARGLSPAGTGPSA